MKASWIWATTLVLSPLPLLADTAVTPEQFVTRAAATGQAEVVLAELALRRAQSPAVRGFANVIVKDRAATNASLARAAKKSAALSPQETPLQFDLDSWRDMPESEFDAAYLRHLVMAHEETVALFRSAAAGDDERLAKFALGNLPMLESHLQQARDLESQLSREPLSLAAN